MFFGEVFKFKDKLMVYVGIIDGTESFIPVDNFIQFASEKLKEVSLFCREKKTNKKFRCDHSGESRFDYIKYDEEDMVLQIYTKDRSWGTFEEDEWEAWVVFGEADHPVMCLAKDYVHDSFQSFCDKMKGVQNNV